MQSTICGIACSHNSALSQTHRKIVAIYIINNTDKKQVVIYEMCYNIYDNIYDENLSVCSIFRSTYATHVIE